MNTAFLLGAGSSVAADFPSTQELTEQVLSGHGVTRHTDGSYYIDGIEAPAQPTLLVNCMVRRLHAKAERYYSVYGERPVNYEDLFYLAKQALDEELGEMENPAIHSFIRELRTDRSLLVKAANKKNEDPNEAYVPYVPDNFQMLLEEACNYMTDVVWRSLCHKPPPESLSQLNLIAYACENVKVASISTLCHDTHVETFLSNEDIALSDGFSQPQRDVRYWNGDLSSDGKIPFIKLHGSVNWFRLRSENGDWYDEKIGIPLNGDYYHTRTVGGVLQTPLDGRPLLLIGTFNKISEYSSGIFRELHYRFRSTIRDANQMVICGYSFGDKGINSEIIEWYYNKQGRRLIIIHPDLENLVRNARGAIRNKWSDWDNNSSISFISKRFEDVDIGKFERVLAKT